MTDARFPERWLNDRRLQMTPPSAYRLFGNGLMWSVANRTDGHIQASCFPLIPHACEADAKELERVSLWLDDGHGGWVIAGFEETQTTAADLAHLAEQRRKNRDRQRRHRDKSRDIPRDVTCDSSRTGQDRPGDTRTGTTAFTSVTNPSTNGEAVYGREVDDEMEPPF
jgi:hypothetical protein